MSFIVSHFCDSDFMIRNRQVIKSVSISKQDISMAGRIACQFKRNCSINTANNVKIMSITNEHTIGFWFLLFGL